MNSKQVLLLITICICSSFKLSAQISIREDEIVEKALLKPNSFDSLTNLAMQDRVIDYKKYIGYKLFFTPKSHKFKPHYGIRDTLINYLFSNKTVQITKEGRIPFDDVMIYKSFGNVRALRGPALQQYKGLLKKYENIDKEETNIYLPHFFYKSTDKTDGNIYGEIGTLPENVEGKYYTIIDIKGKTNFGDKKKEYQKLEDIEIESSGNWQVSLKFLLKNESNTDSLFWEVKQARQINEGPFFLVPYFEKQKKMYLNQNLVLKDKTRTNLKLENLIDVNTGEIVNIKYGEIWTCSDVSFIDSKDSYYLSGFYFLKNGDKEVKIELGSSLISDYFILEAEFKKQELQKQKREEEKRLDEQEREKKEELARIKFKNDCIAKWGQILGSLISDGKVKLDMNKEMCIAAWGNPININRTIVKGLIWEQWVYGWGTYLYFDNDILKTIQD
ncbi:MAG: hypothetical protein Q8R96_06790 [Bacteroidota bacterium]|nr:hypothetical protein [Bacteroidota bacterium]